MFSAEPHTGGLQQKAATLRRELEVGSLEMDLILSVAALPGSEGQGFWKAERVNGTGPMCKESSHPLASRRGGFCLIVLFS